MVAPVAPRAWIGSSRARRANDPRQARLLAHGAGRAGRTVSSTLTDRWQSYGEPSSGGLPTLRGSCAITETGVRLDARPRLLSAVLESECANPTHDRFAKSVLVVRSRRASESCDCVAWLAPNVRVLPW